MVRIFALQRRWCRQTGLCHDCIYLCFGQWRNIPGPWKKSSWCNLFWRGWLKINCMRLRSNDWKVNERRRSMWLMGSIRGLDQDRNYEKNWAERVCRQTALFFGWWLRGYHPKNATENRASWRGIGNFTFGVARQIQPNNARSIFEKIRHMLLVCCSCHVLND